MLNAGDNLDHYRLDAVVARGGMSTLFRATDVRSGRRVALKLPHPEMEADPVVLERFRREQEIGCLLEHPGIVKTLEEEERSRPYLVLEWVDGRLLRAVLNEEGPFSTERAVAMMLALCDAVDAMHKRGIVHRDLKPENVVIGEGDRVTIIDFGIAMKDDARRLTHAGTVPLLGTPDYLSPEQAQGKRGDQRSDIYALGTMFYEMLTGRVPFSGPNPLAAMQERLMRDPEPPSKIHPGVPPAIEEIVFRALEREPRHRYANAHEMQWDLEHPELLGVEVEGSHAHGGLKRPGRRWSGRGVLFYACLALAPLILFALMLALARR